MVHPYFDPTLGRNNYIVCLTSHRHVHIYIYNRLIYIYIIYWYIYIIYCKLYLASKQIVVWDKCFYCGSCIPRLTWTCWQLCVAKPMVPYLMCWTDGTHRYNTKIHMSCSQVAFICLSCRLISFRFVILIVAGWHSRTLGVSALFQWLGWPEKWSLINLVWWQLWPLSHLPRGFREVRQVAETLQEKLFVFDVQISTLYTCFSELWIYHDRYHYMYRVYVYCIFKVSK